jgi:hypothetical protein
VKRLTLDSFSDLIVGQRRTLEALVGLQRDGRMQQRSR